MSYVGLEDAPGGIEATFYDTPNADGDFVPYDLGTLPRDVPHTIRFWIKLNAPPASDLVRVSIDGHDAGQCFTTWANFYRSVSQAVPSIDTLQFRSTGEQENLSLVGGGYLFDNVMITTGNGAGPPGCDVPIEKHAEASSVRAGGLVRYRIAVRNRGRLAARDLLVCDRIPREMTFASADRRLVSRGGRRCLPVTDLKPGGRAGFHIVLRVDEGAPPGEESNVAEELPSVPPPAPAPAVGVLGEKIAPVPPIATTSAKVTVVSKRRARRPASPPPVTG
jgi:uncharacterized repeat protein (TIGR01451 family)